MEPCLQVRLAFSCLPCALLQGPFAKVLCISHKCSGEFRKAKLT